MLFIAIFAEVPRTSALRKIEAKLHAIFIYCFREPRFRIEYGDFGGKEFSLTYHANKSSRWAE